MSDQYQPLWSRKHGWSDRNEVPERLPYQTELGVWSFGPDPGSGYRRRRRPAGITITTVTIAVVALAVLAGAWMFTHRAATAGPLGRTFQGGMECLGLAGYPVMTYGVEWVRNPGTATAVIDQMTLADPEGLRVVAAWVVPTSGLLYGAQVGYPPSKMPLPGWQWAKREPADGARVPHTAGRNRDNLLLVFGLSPGATSGQAAGIEISYHVGSSHYQLRTAQRLVLGPGEVAVPPC